MGEQTPTLEPPLTVPVEPAPEGPGPKLVDSGVALRIGWQALAAMIVVGIAEAATLAGVVVLIGAVIDEVVMARGVSPRLTELLVVTGIVAGLTGITRTLEFGIAEEVGYRYVQRLRMVMYGHLQRVPVRRLQNNSRGAIILRFTGDLSMIRTWISRGIARTVVAVISLLVAIGVLVWISVPMALTAVGVLALGSAVSLAGGRRLRRVAKAVRLRRANLTTNITEQVHSMAVVQTYGRAQSEYDRLARQNTRLTDNLLRFAWVRGMLRGVAASTGWLAAAAVLTIGAFAVTNGSTTIGNLVTAVLVVRFMVRPIRSLGLANDYWQSARVSREKILAFLQRTYPESAGEATNKLRVKGGQIEFQDAYLKGSLHGITATVPARSLIAVMGKNGAGKTSLLTLAARMTEADQGSVLIDGQDLRHCSLRSCAANIAIVSDALPLLRGTVRRNLTYRWRSAPEAEVQRIIKLCGLDEVLASLPYGLESEIREGGANLASGHAARLRLARALMGNPKVLLLDEPSAHLDAESKSIVREVVLRYQGTVLWVTHDPEDAAIADQVWELEAGRLVNVVSGRAFREQIVVPELVPAWARA